MRAENLMTERWEIQSTRNILSLQTNPAWAALKKETEEQFSRVFNVRIPTVIQCKLLSSMISDVKVPGMCTDAQGFLSSGGFAARGVL